ncbi:protein-tyrosine phosphatase, partial [Pavlovales sp. CCMP2436]
LVPPERFGAIDVGLFRSNYPTEANFRFLGSLGLRTAVNLTQERLLRSALAFFAQQGIQLVQLGETSSSEISSGMASDDLLKQALEIALDASAYPLLLMSSSGNHGVGLVVGCLRRLQGWSISSALDEYRSFAAPSSRYTTEQAIELFDLQLVELPAEPPSW